MGEFQTTRGPKRLDQPKISAVNIYEYSSRTSAKGMDLVEAISADLHLPPELGIKQVGESDKVRKSISWKYLTEFILYVIKYP